MRRKSPRPSKDSSPGRGNPTTPHATRARYVAHVVRHTRATPAQLADYLAGFKARGQGAWPSQKHLAERFHVCVRTIQRWLRQLVDAGLILVERHRPVQDHITGRWRRRTNRYRCTWRKTKRTTPPAKDLVSPTRHECRLDGPFGEPCSGPAPPVVAPPWRDAGISPAEWVMRRMGRP